MTRRAFWALLLGLVSPVARAGELDVHIGPPQVGTGGSNPVSIPPVNFLDYEFVYATDHDFETSIAVAPGIFFGKRSRTGAVYVSFGGGLAIDANGAGPGLYSACGISEGKGIKFNMELKQAIGYDLSSAHMISPFALRAGVAFDF